MVVSGFRVGLGSMAFMAALGVLAGCGSSDEPAQSSEEPKAGLLEALGDPCLPGGEGVASFSGSYVRDVSVEVDSPDCGGGAVCLVSHFQGRVSCPYGQSAEEAAAGTGSCFLPHSNEKVTVEVAPQYLARQPDRAVYCSCRCAGADASAKYCECAAGMECLELVPDVGLGATGAGSYCVKKGAEPDDITSISLQTCDAPGTPLCGPSQPLPP